MMDIQLWSDFLCPYCVLGKRRLQKALDSLGIRDAGVTMKSFLLNPGEDEPAGMRMREHLMSKYQYTEDEVAQTFNTLGAAGLEIGFPFHFGTALHAGTDRAHALFQYMKTLGLGSAFSDLLQEAGFQLGADLHDEETLIRIARQLGAKEDEAKKAIHSGEFLGLARQEHEEAIRYGARGVPFFVINERFAIAGAQPLEVFENTLKKAAGL